MESQKSVKLDDCIDREKLYKTLLTDIFLNIDSFLTPGT